MCQIQGDLTCFATTKKGSGVVKIQSLDLHPSLCTAVHVEPDVLILISVCLLVVQHPLPYSLSRTLPSPSVERWAPKTWPPVSEKPSFSVIHGLKSHRGMSVERGAARREGHGHSEPVWCKHRSSRHHLRRHVWHVWR